MIRHQLLFVLSALKLHIERSNHKRQQRPEHAFFKPCNKYYFPATHMHLVHMGKQIIAITSLFMRYPR